MGAREFLNKLEKDLKNLSGNKVVDVSNLDLTSANFLKNSYDGIYQVHGPIEDSEHPGTYAISFSLLNREVMQNA